MSKDFYKKPFKQISSFNIMEDKGMVTNSLYKEEISSKGSLILSTSIMIISLLILWFQLFINSFHPPFLNWIYLVIILICLITINFSKLTIKITSEKITIRYGIVGHTLLWNKVEDVFLDETSMIRYGGWGLRIGRFGGKWRLIFNVIGKKCVLLQLNQGRFRELVFSTNSPEEIVKIIRERVF